MKMSRYIEGNRDRIDEHILLDLCKETLEDTEFYLLSEEEMDDIREDYIYNNDAVRDMVEEDGLEL